MPRKHLVRSQTLPYHVTARSNNKEPFPLDLGAFWTIACAQLYALSLLREAHVHAFVLMPNHFHLLISTPSQDLGVLMREFMKSLTQSANLKAARSGRLFGGTYHWSLIDSDVYFAHAFKYVYRNPVRAGLCFGVEDYPFSTLGPDYDFNHRPFPLWYPFGLGTFSLIPNDSDERLSWLNHCPSAEHETQVRKALRKSNFAPPREGWRRTLSELAKSSSI